MTEIKERIRGATGGPSRELGMKGFLGIALYGILMESWVMCKEAAAK